MSAAARPSPPGYPLAGTPVELLGARAGTAVWRARLDGRDVVVRASRRADGAGDEALAELAVLGAYAGPGTAHLSSWGTAEGGQVVYAVREWIEGRDLLAWSRERASVDPVDLGRIAARIARTLGALHAEDFVHGDLKPENVLVRADGEAVLTDFGLSHVTGSAFAPGAAGASGSFFAIAPEVLLGAPGDHRSDLFALGVLLHRLALRPTTPAREFYARFPHVDFWVATDTEPGDLPAALRDVVVDLLALDPADRPASGAEVARTLEARLGLEPPASAADFDAGAPRWTVRRGREDWFSAHAASLGREPRTWIQVDPAESPSAVARELSLLALLEGRAVRTVSLEGEPGATDALALDAWAQAQVEAGRGAVSVLALDGAGSRRPGPRRALEAFARAAEAFADCAVVVVAAQDAEAGWSRTVLPAVPEESVRDFLRAELDADSVAQIDDFARALWEACRGGAAALDDALDHAWREGALRAGAEKPRLRAGARPVAPGGHEWVVGGPEARLAAALVVAGTPESPATLSTLADWTLERTTAQLRSPTWRSALLFARTARGVTAALRSTQLPAIDLPAEEWRAICARRAHALRSAATPSRRAVGPRGEQSVLAWSAQPDEARAERLAAALRGLREQGSAELALEHLQRLDELAVRVGAAVPPPVEYERILTWHALGETRRAEEAVSALDRGEPEVRALAERARGHLAAAQEPAAALAHFERAAELDPSCAGEALFGRVRLLRAAGRDAEVCALLGSSTGLEGAGLEAAGLDERVRTNLHMLHALSLARLGKAAEARALLQRTLAATSDGADPLAEATLRLNLSNILRQAGDVEEALPHLERASELYASAGFLAGYAQARAQLGAALRQAGELARAEPLLRSALGLRERQGDRLGGASVRGMLGMLYADRGVCRAAIAELERSAEELTRAGRRSEAGLYAARCAEQRARIGDLVATSENRGAAGRARTRTASETERLGEGDPRILLILARTAAMRGEGERAQTLALRAEGLGERLGQAALSEEARLLRFALAPEEAASPPRSTASRGPRLEDARILDLLARAELDSAAAADLGDELFARGRTDRAARLYLAAASRARSADEAASQAWAARAEECLDDCARGLTPDEREALRHALLAVPDPWPGDLTRRPTPKTAEEDEMEIRSLLEINHKLLCEEDVGTLLGSIVEHAIELSGAERGFLMLEEDGAFEFDTAMDSRRGDIEFPDLEISQSVLVEALEHMRPLRVSNAMDDPALGSAPSVVNLDLRSVLCVPFRVSPTLRGALYLDHRLRVGAFDERAEGLLALLSDQAGLAILQVRRMAEIKRLNRELESRMVSKDSDLRAARRRLQEVGMSAPAGGLVGDSQVMQNVHRLIERAAGNTLPVLVVGPSGSGKELAARALHELSQRSDGPFITENCAALPPSLIEAELFGAVKGAYTGSERTREGLFERAHGGTLFLDEIGEMPLELQAKLLRALETGEIRRLGDDQVRRVDFRLVAATNRRLEDEVEAGRFRADLMYRLDGLRVQMPALSEHPEDIPELVEHWVRLQEARSGAGQRISEAVVARLGQRGWPGNVRQLYNELARLCAVTDGDVDDPDLVRDDEPAATPGLSAAMTLEELERAAIEQALARTGGDKRRAAELLGISRSKLYQRLKDWREADSN